MAKKKTSSLGLRKGNRRRDCRTSATLPTHRPSVFSSSLNGGPSMSILPWQSEVPERKKETKRMVDRVMELSSHRQSIVTPSPECSIPSTKSARHASPLYCRRACTPSSLYYTVTRPYAPAPLPLLADAEAISSEQSPEVVPSRRCLSALAPFLLHLPR